MSLNIKKANVSIFNGWRAGAFLVNPVNTVGIMGKGLALQFKKERPTHFDKYKSLCENNQMILGKVWIDEENQIIAFPTKADWRSKSKEWVIQEGLKDLHIKVKEKGIKKIYIPKIGCDLGGLDYETQVKHLILKEFSGSEINVVIVEQ